jgi:hypothetical protein
MNKLLFTLTLIVLFTACKKDSNTDQPTASFTFSHNQANEFSLVTTDTTMLISSAENASSVRWDLGDGRTSESNQLVLSYPKSGTYTVTLTAKAQNGKQTTVSKKVKVLDRVLKEINIKRIYWSLDPNFRDTSWPLTANADVYLKIQLLKKGEEIFHGAYPPNAEVIYTSPVIKNVSNSGKESYGFILKDKIVLEKKLLEDRRYLISLIAKNASGEHWLTSNWAGGSSQTINFTRPSFNGLIVNLSFFSEIEMYLYFE